MKALVLVLALFSSTYAHALVFDYLNCKAANGLIMSLDSASKQDVTVSYLAISKPFKVAEGPMYNKMTKTTNIGLADEALLAENGDSSFYEITLNGELTISGSVHIAQGVVEYTYVNGIIRVPATSPKGGITCKYKVSKDAFGE